MIPDPANPQSFNRYSYVIANPLKFRDPTGHCAEGDPLGGPCLDGGGNRRAKEWSIPGETTDADTFRSQLLAALAKYGEIGQQTAEYMQENDVQIVFGNMTRWTLGGDIMLNSAHYPSGFRVFYNGVETERAFLLGSVVHEATHLEQGLGAFSVEGEVYGWAAEYKAREDMAARGLGDPRDRDFWETVEEAYKSPTDDNLKKTRSLMVDYDKTYTQINWYPLRVDWYLPSSNTTEYPETPYVLP